MYASLAIVFAVVDFLLILLTVFTVRLNLFAVLHALLFWAFIVAFHVITVFVLAPQYDLMMYLLVQTLLTVYLGIFLVTSASWGASDLLGRIRAIPYSVILVVLLPWLAFKCYLLGRYGLASFSLLALRAQIDAFYWEAVLNSLFWYFALGGFLAFVIRAASDAKAFGQLPVLMASTAVFVFASVFGEVGGARRFILTVAALGILTLVARQRPLRVRTLMTMVLILVLSLIAVEYYQHIRVNATDPQVMTLLAEGEIAEGIVAYLALPEDDDATVTYRNFQERVSPFEILYAISAQQIDHRRLLWGAATRQSFINVIPSIFYPEKETINADAVLAEAFDWEPIDLPTGVLAMFQADWSWVAYLITPVLFAYLIRGYSGLLLWSDNHFLRLLFLAGTVLTATYVEEVFDAILINVRDILPLVLLIGGVVLLKSISSRGRRAGLSAPHISSSHS
jgi:hypothetical protein